MIQRVIGNWKLNGSQQQITSVLTKLTQAGYGDNLGVCVPCPYIQLACQLVKESQIQIGAQDISQYEKGAYTGEVSAQMIVDVGAQFTLIGHSERRTCLAEFSSVLKNKIAQAVAAGLYVIFCVGEDLAIRKSGQADSYVLDALKDLEGVESERFAVAYEPLWAIGTGLTASLEEISNMHAVIKSYIGKRVPVLYGGSVRAANAADILAVKGVDGLLVGGASLNADEFIAIGHCARLS